MSFMIMADGQEMHLGFPDVSHIPPETFAHHLAIIPRFTGATCRPYTVAEHSLLVVEIAEREMRLNPHILAGCLWHDGHEAITNDLSSPSKCMVGQAWHDFEVPMANAVIRRFNLVDTFKTFRSIIRHADLRALATERGQLLRKTDPWGRPLADWPVLLGIEPVDWVDLMDPGRVSFTWQDWRDQFMAKHEELAFARAEMAAHPNGGGAA